MQDQAIIQLLLTGNEIMSGDTVDSNSAAIALHIAQHGLSIHRKVTLPDNRDLLRAEITALAQQSHVLIINGGLGPTLDDLTAQVLAEAAKLPLEENAAALNHLKQWCKRRGASLNAANLTQAQLPEGCTIIDNPRGSAVGFAITMGKCLVLCTPGVPSELRSMFEQVTDMLGKHLNYSGKSDIVRLQCLGIGESTVQQMISDACPDWPEQVELGFRAGVPQLEVKLTISKKQHKKLQEQCRTQLYQLFGDHIIGEGNTRIAETVLALLARQKKTLTTAESCTGGLIASMLTEIPGSSLSFHAGFVTYANHIKSSVVGVSENSLIEHGAVSESVVRQMAMGAIEKSGSDYAIAVSGVAGPDGGSSEKPVGTVWIAWGTRDNIKSHCLYYPIERKLFQSMVAAIGLDLIRRELMAIDSSPQYFKDKKKNLDSDTDN